MFLQESAVVLVRPEVVLEVWIESAAMTPARTRHDSQLIIMSACVALAAGAAQTRPSTVAQGNLQIDALLSDQKLVNAAQQNRCFTCHLRNTAGTPLVRPRLVDDVRDAVRVVQRTTSAA